VRRYRVVVEPEAQADLEAIEAYIAREGNPEAGERFVTEALDLCRSLDRFLSYGGAPIPLVRAQMMGGAPRAAF